MVAGEVHGFLGPNGAGLGYAWPVLPYVAPVLALSAMARLLDGLAPRALVVAWLPLVLAVVVLAALTSLGGRFAFRRRDIG